MEAAQFSSASIAPGAPRTSVIATINRIAFALAAAGLIVSAVWWVQCTFSWGA